jgi:hypothetical protein
VFIEVFSPRLALRAPSSSYVLGLFYRLRRRSIGTLQEMPDRHQFLNIREVLGMRPMKYQMMSVAHDTKVTVGFFGYLAHMTKQ